MDINQKANRKFFTQLEPSFDQLKEQLIYGCKQIQRQNAQTLLFYLQYGTMLITANTEFKKQKHAGEYKKTWEIFLCKSVGISLSYAGKLKDLAFDLDPQAYPQFLSLGLSFSEIMSLKKDIIKMLNKEQFSTFWKTPVLVPDTPQESQEASS